jgi:hypothetical protein
MYVILVYDIGIKRVAKMLKIMSAIPLLDSEFCIRRRNYGGKTQRIGFEDGINYG